MADQGYELDGKTVAALAKMYRDSQRGGNADYAAGQTYGPGEDRQRWFWGKINDNGTNTNAQYKIDRCYVSNASTTATDVAQMTVASSAPYQMTVTATNIAELFGTTGFHNLPDGMFVRVWWEYDLAVPTPTVRYLINATPPMVWVKFGSPLNISFGVNYGAYNGKIIPVPDNTTTGDNFPPNPGGTFQDCLITNAAESNATHIQGPIVPLGYPALGTITQITNAVWGTLPKGTPKVRVYVPGPANENFGVVLTVDGGGVGTWTYTATTIGTGMTVGTGMSPAKGPRGTGSPGALGVCFYGNAGSTYLWEANEV
jgi:hypothetical protein